MTDSSKQRRVVAWASVSVDGCTSGPNGPAEDNWLYEHATKPGTGEHYEGVWRHATSAIVGRTNYEGFASVWPGGGLRLLPDGLPPSRWELASSTTLSHGAVAIHYRRATR